MNRHLNIFKTYTREDRDYQLENDLTRAFAVTLLEDNLFLHDVLKYILEHKKDCYHSLFDDFSGKQPITIDIQKRVTHLNDFEHLFAVSLSDYPMDLEHFFNQNYDKNYDPVTDLVISIDNVTIIIEVKPNNQNCTAQLYNQAFNALNQSISPENVTPVDLNWNKLMEITLRVANFEKAIARPSRFVTDFIQFIQVHNYRWLPQTALHSLSIKGDANRITDRIETAITNSEFKKINGRLGFECDVHWADEILFDFDSTNETFEARIYPGNTKGQGYHIFPQTGEPIFKKQLELEGINYEVIKSYHIKFTSWKRYFTGLWAAEKDIKNSFYTRANFNTISGRIKNKDWNKIELFFDNHFETHYDWKKYCDWNNKVLKSGKTQFDLSLGYELKVSIPYSIIQNIDRDKNDLKPLITFLENIKNEFESLLLKQ
jgi:hypothetical protein